jgi:hypothetical protein
MKSGNRRAPFDTTPEKMGSTQGERQKWLTMHIQPLALRGPTGEDAGLERP